MVKRTGFRAFLLVGVTALGAIVLRAADAPQNATKKKLRFDERYGRDASGNLSLLSKDRPDAPKREPDTSAADVLKDLKDDTVFVQIGDEDQLSWKALHEQVDALFKTKIDLLLKAPGGQTDEVKLGLYRQGVSKLLQQYLKTAVVAREAKRRGIVISRKDIDSELGKIKAKARGRTLGAFQYQFLTNGLYQKAYVEKYLKPSIHAPDEAVRKLIAERHAVNLSVPGTNALFKAQMEDIRARLAKNEISFGDAADEYSECPQCSSDSGDCGTWEQDDSDIAPELLKVCFSLPTNTVSPVVETADAFHIVKIVSKYQPTKKAMEEEGEVPSVDVRHIQVDKWQLDPEFTPETARKFIEGRMLMKELKIKQFELLKTAPIKCVIPLQERKRTRGSVRTFK